MNKAKNILSTKYFILLASLSEKEKTDLLELANCYSFNPSQKILKLLELTTFSNIVTQKKTIFNALFPNTEYDDRKLRNIFSRTFLFIQKFLAYQYFNKNELQYQETVIKSLQEKELTEYADSRIKKWKKELENTIIFDDDFFVQQMNFYNIDFHKNLKALSQKTRAFDLSSEQYNKALDESFLLKKMKLFISSFNYQSIVNANEEFTMLEEIISFIESKKDWNQVIIVYYHLLMIHYKPELDIHFNKLKSHFNFIDKSFPLEQKREIYLLIQNFAIKKINTGKSEYLKELLSLFKIMLENNTIYSNNVLSQWSYKNIVTVALRSNETEWCLNFIDNFKNKLDIPVRKSTYFLAKAKYYFFTKEYSETLKIIKNVVFEDSISMINSKTIQIKSYYELDDIDSLQSSIENLDKILQRKKILSKNYLKRYKSFNKYLKKIISITGKKTKEKLFDKLNLEKAIVDKKWLKEKLVEKM